MPDTMGNDAKSHLLSNRGVGDHVSDSSAVNAKRFKPFISNNIHHLLSYLATTILCVYDSR